MSPLRLLPLLFVLGAFACSSAGPVRERNIREEVSALMEAGDTSAAVSLAFEEVGRERSDEARLLLVETAEAVGRDEAAVSAALGMRGEEYLSRAALPAARAAYRLGRYEEAISFLERLGPDDLEARRLKGLSLFGMRRFREAAEEYSEILSIHPEAPAGWYTEYGLALMMNGDDSAREVWESVAPLDPAAAVLLNGFYGDGAGSSTER